MNSIKNGEVLLLAKLPSVFEKLNLREIYISKLILHLNLIQCFILLFDLFYDETVKQKSEGTQYGAQCTGQDYMWDFLVD